MCPSKIAGIAIAACFIVTPSAFAQTKAAQTKSSGTAATQTFAGCLMTEPDYRRAHNLGGGSLGGVGLGDEFVLVDVKLSAAKGTAEKAPASDSSGGGASTSASTSSTSACADRGTAYRLTGTAEEKIKGLVGRQLEIQGRFKHSDDAAAGGTRPGEKLPAEVEIVSFREAPAPTPVSEPATSPTSPTPAASTGEPARAQGAASSTSPRTELPHSASSTALLVLIGVMALSSGIAVTVIRRRAL